MRSRPLFNTMLPRLRRHPLQRALALLLALALLSVAGSAHACKATQMLSLAGLAATSLNDVHGSAHAANGDIDGPARQPADLLRQGGPCHLLIAVALPTGPNEPGGVVLFASWPLVAALGFDSCNWPPPKHRPRAA